VESITKKFNIRFDGAHGHLKTYVAALSELRACLLPGWVPYWEKAETGEDQLALLSPELTEKYRTLVASERKP
jgi:hypothetical protein